MKENGRRVQFFFQDKEAASEERTMIMDNKKRIEELKRKNKITNLCKIWIDKDILISILDFLEIQETLYLQRKILDKLEKMDIDNQSMVYSEQETNIISIFTEKLINNIDNNKKYVFFIKGVNKIGGLVLSGKIIKENAGFIIGKSEIFDRGCNIFFSSLNAENGICLWEGEYDSRIYVW